LERLGEKVGGVLSNNALLDGYVEDLFSD